MSALLHSQSVSVKSWPLICKLWIQHKDNVGTCLPQVRADDNLPKAICHDCLQQVGAMHLYAVKVEKTQKFLDFHKMKTVEEKRDVLQETTLHPIITALSMQKLLASAEKKLTPSPVLPKSPPTSRPDHQQGDTKPAKPKSLPNKRKSPSDLKFLESMTLDEFASSEKVDKSLLSNPSHKTVMQTLVTRDSNRRVKHEQTEFVKDCLDPVVLIDGRPAKQGAALDKQITLFYKMECCICHENGFHFRSLMKHYKDRHGVPGYVTCCDKKFHYFYPKKIIEHMAFHLQTNIFM